MSIFSSNQQWDPMHSVDHNMQSTWPQGKDRDCLHHNSPWQPQRHTDTHRFPAHSELNLGASNEGQQLLCCENSSLCHFLSFWSSEINTISYFGFLPERRMMSLCWQVISHYVMEMPSPAITGLDFQGSASPFLSFKGFTAHLALPETSFLFCGESDQLHQGCWPWGQHAVLEEPWLWPLLSQALAWVGLWETFQTCGCCPSCLSFCGYWLCILGTWVALNSLC